MSDKSEYSSSDSESDNEQGLDYEPRSSTEDSGSGSDDGTEDGEETGDKSTSKVVDVSKLTLCSDHKSGEMTFDCSSCSAALSLISDKHVVKTLTSTAQ